MTFTSISPQNEVKSRAPQSFYELITQSSTFTLRVSASIDELSSLAFQKLVVMLDFLQ